MIYAALNPRISAKDLEEILQLECDSRQKLLDQLAENIKNAPADRQAEILAHGLQVIFACVPF